MSLSPEAPTDRRNYDFSASDSDSFDNDQQFNSVLGYNVAIGSKNLTDLTSVSVSGLVKSEPMQQDDDQDGYLYIVDYYQ